MTILADFGYAVLISIVTQRNLEGRRVLLYESQ